MSGSIRSLACSFAFHALLALAFVVWAGFGKQPIDEPAELDISSVDLSLSDSTAEVEGSTAAKSTPETQTVPDVRPPAPEPVDDLPPPAPAPDARTTPDHPSPSQANAFSPVAAPPSSSSLPAPSAPHVIPRPGGNAGQVDAPPSLTRTIKPEYPKGARQRGEQGTVVLDAVVGAAGRAADISVIRSSGYADLDEAAVHALRAAKFRPAKYKGRAVESTARLTLEFRLKE